MPDPADQSIQPTRANLDAAERLQLATRCAAESIRAAVCRLLFDVRGIPRGEAPLVDGAPAVVDGEEVDLVEWGRSRVEGLCLRGPLADGLHELEAEAEADQVEALARYVREARR